MNDEEEAVKIWYDDRQSLILRLTAFLYFKSTYRTIPEVFRLKDKKIFL